MRESADFREQHETQIDLNPGDVLIIHPMLLHAGGDNKTADANIRWPSSS